MFALLAHRQLVVTAALLTGVVLLTSAGRPQPLRPQVARSAPSSHLRAVHAFERHQLSLRDTIVRLAQAQVGMPYVLGGTTPRHGFDCSGLVRWVFSQVHVTPPRLARQQARIGAPIRRESLRPGDLLAFGERDSVTHIGIYVGDGRYVHASSVAGRVIVSPLDRRPSKLIRPLASARRVLITAGLERPSGF